MTAQDTIEAIQWLACQSHKEICGVIDDQDKFYQIENVASSPNNFILNKFQFFSLLNKFNNEGTKVKCIFHSHLDGDCSPSDKDLLEINRLKIPYLIVAGSKYSYTEPSNE